MESEKFSNKAEDISNTFLVIFETLPDTQRVSRQITVYNVTKDESEAMAGSLWTKSHVIEVISERNVKIRTKGKIESEIKEVVRPDPKFSDKIKETKSKVSKQIMKAKSNIFVNQNRSEDKSSKKIKLANSNASEEKEKSANGVFKITSMGRTST